MAVTGIDISHWQGTPDEERVAQQGFAFCFHKATEGCTNADPRYAENRKLLAPHMLWGAYHLIRLNEPIDTQVRSFLTAALLQPGDLPPVLDVEVKRIDEVDSKRAWRGIVAWLSMVRDLAGVRPILYISPRGVRHLHGWLDGLNLAHLWVCDYTDKPEPELPETFPRWLFWQYSSSGDGRAAGFESDGLDLNRFDGNRRQLLRLTKWR